jgi:hypothetical protein
MMWVLVVVLINGSFGNSIVTIPGFKSLEDCQKAADFARKRTAGDTRVRDAFCLLGPTP